MSLSVKQYALLLGLLLIALVSTFAYKINNDLNDTRANIIKAQASAAENELDHAINITMQKIRQSAEELSQWQEVRQQINNPEIFAYWYSVRFRKAAFDLQKFTADFMIYDINGKALDKLDNSTLPYEIHVNNSKRFFFNFENSTDIVYIKSVFDNDRNQVIGYLSARLQLLPLITSASHLQHIEPESLSFNTDNPEQYISHLEPSHFSYDLRKSPGILTLESQMRKSILDLVLIIVIPAMIIYILIIIIVGKPIKDIDNYINLLRTKPDTETEGFYQGNFKVTELMSVYDSLHRYHTELSEKEQYLSLTLNSIGDAVITTDANTSIVRMNPVAEYLTGWSIEEAAGKLLKDIFNIKNQPNDHNNDLLDQVISTGHVVHVSQDCILTSRSGKQYCIADSAAPIRDKTGAIHGIVLVFNDITEQKKKDEQLQQSLKMDALGKLTGGIAHDFNNVLGVILGYSELLIKELADQPKSLGYAQQINTAGERARNLTSKLLTFSRKKTSESTRTDINTIVESERSMLEKTLTARIELELDLEENLWPVYIDKNQIQDAILNICINAMHAMPNGGKIIISSHNLSLGDKEGLHIDLEPGDYVQLSITDNGSGMDQETRAKIFDPFFTTKGDLGTGLGMSQVYGFMQQSGGAINVYSEVGHGTRISMYFPRYQNEEQDDEKSAKSDTDNFLDSRGDETILVVDDEKSLLELSCNILTRHGYNTLCASNAEQALDILEKQPVNLMVTDVIMPGMDGYQLAERVAEAYPETRIQIISGFSDDRSNAAQDPALLKHQLQKPFHASELLKRIREILDN